MRKINYLISVLLMFTIVACQNKKTLKDVVTVDNKAEKIMDVTPLYACEVVPQRKLNLSSHIWVMKLKTTAGAEMLYQIQLKGNKLFSRLRCDADNISEKVEIVNDVQIKGNQLEVLTPAQAHVKVKGTDKLKSCGLIMEQNKKFTFSFVNSCLKIIDDETISYAYPQALGEHSEVEGFFVGWHTKIKYREKNQEYLGIKLHSYTSIKDLAKLNQLTSLERGILKQIVTELIAAEDIIIVGRVNMGQSEYVESYHKPALRNLHHLLEDLEAI